MRRILNFILLFVIMFAVAASYKNMPVNGFTADKNKFGNIVICIDPGHQLKGNPATEPEAPGSKIKKAKVTSGTTGIITRVPEYKLNLKISLKVRDLLKKDGFKVVMTRDSNDVDLSNIDRAQIANRVMANLFLRVHADGSNDRNMHGISILFPAKSSISEKLYRTSKSAAGEVLREVASQTLAKSNGIVERSDMTGFNWSKVPVILIEAGFMTNPEEDRKLEDNTYENKLASGIVMGIESYFKK